MDSSSSWQEVLHQYQDALPQSRERAFSGFVYRSNAMDRYMQEEREAAQRRDAAIAPYWYVGATPVAIAAIEAARAGYRAEYAVIDARMADAVREIYAAFVAGKE